MSDQALIIQHLNDLLFRFLRNKSVFGIDTKEIGSIWLEEAVIAITVNDRLLLKMY